MNKELKKQYVDESFNWEKRDLFRINQILIDLSSIVNRSDTPFLLFEMMSMKLLEMDQSVLIDQLLSSEELDTDEDKKNIPSSQKTLA